MRAHVFVMTILLFTGFISHAQQSQPSSSPPLSVSDIEHGLKAGVTNTRMAALVKQYGVDFELTDAVEKELRAVGADSDLLLQIARKKRESDASEKQPRVAPNSASERTTSTRQANSVTLGKARPALGITTISINPELAGEMGLPADYGLLIVQVTAGGSAEQARLKGGTERAYMGNIPIMLDCSDRWREGRNSAGSGADNEQARCR